MAALSQLHQQIEELALRLVLGENGSVTPENQNEALLPQLEAIQASAAQCGACSIAHIAAGIIAGIRGEAASDANTGIPEGIANLQRALHALEQETADAPAPLAQDPELLTDFVVESREHLASIEAQVLTLERDPGNSESLHSVFRSFHTIKGLSGFLELWEVQKLAHEVETVLDKARNGQLAMTPAAIDVILESSDYVRRWLAHVESLLQNLPSPAPARDESLLARVTRISSAESSQDSGLELPALAAAVENSTPESSHDNKRRNQTMAVKVDTAKLDYLADMAGEMVIAEALVRHDPELAKTTNPRLQRNLAQLTRITVELQKTAMSMRLVPIGPLFRRMARLARDLSRQFAKPVEFITEGDNIELDRTIAEELADPLMHMIRNSLDHGIESPEERRQAGKAATARLLLKAQHQSGQVVVEISDDGRGLERDRILARAIEKGLVSAEDQLTESEIYNLIFRPGFTTAAQVTSVSGRGVGMDVVRRHIEKLRGRIEIRSSPGQGASFFLKLPLTLAIIDGLVVGVGSERYIIPLFAVREMFRPQHDTIWTVQHQAEMALVRGTLLPVLRLYRRFGVMPRSEDPRQSVLVVAEVESKRFCILVDELLGKQEVVIKSLGETFKNATGVAGGAILGDGRVGLILDLDRLSKDKSIDANS